MFFEYTLIAGVNDGLDDARRLVALLQSIPSKVNLIRMNPHPGCEFRPPTEEVVDRFLRELAGRGATVTLRRSRGSDIDAACGQLALRRAGDAARAWVGRAADAPPTAGAPDKAAAFGDRKASGGP